MKVIGHNVDCGLAGSLSNQIDTLEDIDTLTQSSLDVTSLLSFSTWCHSVWIMQNGEAFAVGSNKCGEIMSTMKKTKFSKDTKIEFQYKNCQPCKFISAVCGFDFTLYEVSEETSTDSSQLIYAYKDKETIFLNIGKRSPLSLFGGRYTSAVIDTEGAVSIITDSVFNSPTTELEFFNLPGNEKAVKAACGDDRVIVLSESGRVFECSLKATKKSFSEVTGELSKVKIVEISGTTNHFFAISDKGKVFGLGSNDRNKLGMPNDVKKVNEFKLVESLDSYHVVEAFAGISESVFKTSKGEILACGSNSNGKLMLKDASISNAYPPVETAITHDTTFCILGNAKSVVFCGVEPPQNTPNRKVSKFPEPKKTSKLDKDEREEFYQKLLEAKEKENLLLKQKLYESEKRVVELEAENKKLRESKTMKKEDQKEKELEVFDAQTLDKMNRIKLLGKGATSEVFKVAREVFALKVYYPDLVTESNDDDNDKEEEEEKKIVINPYKMQSFMTEIESLQVIDHPNIVKIFGFFMGDTKHPPAILLEYCRSNLKEKIKKLTNSERIRAIVDISSAMKEVHSIGLIHRDLKLENILLDENNRIKVSDFGLCALIELDAETLSRTTMKGTLKYMAPEIFQERKDYDEKVDVYAFGVVVYLILTKGEFPKISVADVSAGKKADIPNSITDFSRELIDRCWSCQASERPSFAEICDTLKGKEDKLI
ncbi:hypothetical protein M9Y10_023100 [Tritrichomonas musculus]|uniref:Protein kinase domain-containing protein n=1 Tax=Tritrichomonas musculus TaxID=1915356 RepID=A0ABR2KV00_9EUKA